MSYNSSPSCLCLLLPMLRLKTPRITTLSAFCIFSATLKSQAWGLQRKGIKELTYPKSHKNSGRGGHQWGGGLF